MKILNFFLPEKNKHVYIIFVIFALITLVLTFGNINTTIDNDVSILLPVNQETEYERENMRVLGKEFPSSQVVIVGVKNNPFAPDKIEKLWQFCNELNSLEVAKSTLNPFNAVYFEKFGDSFKLGSYNMHSYPKTKEEIDEFINKLYANRYLVGSVISYDKQTAGIVISMNYNALMGKKIENKSIFIKMLEFLFNRSYGEQKIDRSYFCQKIEEVINKYNKDFEIFFAGVPVYEAKTKYYMQRDIFVLIIPVMLVMILTFYLNFKSFRGVAIPVLTILLSMGWTMGVISWLRFKINIIGILIPPLIMTIGSSYTIQYLNSFYMLLPLYTDKRELLRNSTLNILSTIFLAAITTMVGFGSFLIARIKPIREFGLFINISIVFTLFITFFLISNILVRMPLPHPHRSEKIKKDYFSKIITLTNKAVFPLRFLWIFIYILGIVLFVIYLPKIKVETNAASYFKDKDLVKQSLVFLQKNFGGTNNYNITVRSIDNKRNFFKTREGLLTAKKIHDYLNNNVIIDGYKMIGWFVSPVTLIEDLNYVLEGKRDIPEDEKIIKRFFTYLKVSNVDWVNSIINRDFSAITFQVRPATDNAKNDFIMTEQELSKLTKRLREDLANIAKEDGTITVTLWGEILLLSKISSFLISDQIWSLTVSAILVFLICLLYFRSFFFGLVSLVPLSFGVIMSFTIMAILGIPLDVATVMIASISIGIGVDNSIHFLIHYRRNLKKFKDIKEVISETLKSTSRPIFFTAMALVLGFTSFALSSFRPVAYFGLLIALSMLACAFATLFILPSFLLVLERIKIFFRHR